MDDKMDPLTEKVYDSMIQEILELSNTTDELTATQQLVEQMIYIATRAAVTAIQEFNKSNEE